MAGAIVNWGGRLVRAVACFTYAFVGISHTSKSMRIRALILCLFVTLSTSACATVTGACTGAFTGLVDAPAEVYRHNRQSFDEHPMQWPMNILVVTPLGFAFGEVVAFFRGIALDVECLIGNEDVGDVFGSYGRNSVWRPYSFGW